MKKRLLAVFVLAVMTAPAAAYAAPEGEGAAKAAQEHAGDRAVFNRTADWFATAGKPAEEKEKILNQRKAERRVKHAAKEAEKKTKKAEKMAQKKTKDTKKLAASAQKDLAKTRKEMARKTA